jgi:hypothetical protein
MEHPSNGKTPTFQLPPQTAGAVAALAGIPLHTPPLPPPDKKVTSPLQSPCGISRSKPAWGPILQAKLNGLGRLVPPDRLSRNIMR